VARALEATIKLLIGKNAAFDAMDDGIHARPRVTDEEIHGGERLALRREGDLDRVIHAARAEHLHVFPVGSDAEDACCLSFEDSAFLARNDKRALAVGPVDPAIGPEKRAVNITAVAAKIELPDKLLALRDPAFALGFCQAPQTGRGGRVER